MLSTSWLYLACQSGPILCRSEPNIHLYSSFVESSQVSWVVLVDSSLRNLMLYFFYYYAAVFGKWWTIHFRYPFMDLCVWWKIARQSDPINLFDMKDFDVKQTYFLAVFSLKNLMWTMVLLLCWCIWEVMNNSFQISFYGFMYMMKNCTSVWSHTLHIKDFDWTIFRKMKRIATTSLWDLDYGG